MENDHPGRQEEYGEPLSGDFVTDANHLAEKIRDKVEGRDDEVQAWWVAAAGDFGFMVGGNTGDKADVLLLQALLASLGPKAQGMVVGQILRDAPDFVLDRISDTIDELRNGGGDIFTG